MVNWNTGYIGGVSIVHLPLPSSSPLLSERQPEMENSLVSARLVSNASHPFTQRQLPRLLARQNVRGIVFSSATAFGVDDVQLLVHTASRTCESVSVVGSFARMRACEHLPVKIGGKMRQFTLMDTAGSLVGNTVILFGNLAALRTLVVHVDGDVHLIGQMALDAHINIKARSLVVNGSQVPSTPPGFHCYEFTSVPHVPPPVIVPMQPMPPMPPMYSLPPPPPPPPPPRKQPVTASPPAEPPATSDTSDTPATSDTPNTSDPTPALLHPKPVRPVSPPACVPTP